MTFIQISKRTGENIDPCGTPAQIVTADEVLVFDSEALTAEETVDDMHNSVWSIELNDLCI